MPSEKKMYVPDQIWLHPEADSFPMTDRIRKVYPSVPGEIVSSIEERIQTISGAPQFREKGKKILYLGRHKGRVLKPCQGICDPVACCLYHVVDFACNCPLDCSYCLLQSYLNNPLLQIYVNTEEMIDELSWELSRRRDRFFRIGTGELTDSLAMDPVTRLSIDLVPMFSRQTNAVLELKTKTVHIENLKGLDHRGKTVISWSLNTPFMIRTEEGGAAGLEERLQAAIRCSEWGYPIGFHFDPLVYYPGWEEHYRQTVDMLFDALDGRRIAWISLGALRCPPGLLEILRERFPHSPLPLGEFIRGLDGKMRYFRPLRVELFRKLSSWIRERRPQQTVYLCMEGARVWEQVFGFRATPPDVCSLLDAAVGFENKTGKSCNFEQAFTSNKI